MGSVRGTLGVALAAGALLLVWALLAAPAFADAKAHGGTLQYVDCDQVQNAAGIQYNAGSGSGEVSQELDITQEQALTCLGDDDRNDGNKNDGNKNDDKNNANDDTASADTEDKADDVLSDTIVKGVLPNTGGLSLPALAAYALVVTGVVSLTRLLGRGR